MKSNVPAFAVALCLVLAIAVAKNEPPTHDAVMAEQADVMQQLVDAMKSAKDEASAKAAAGKVKELRARARDVEQRLNALGQPPADAAAKHGAKLQALQKEFVAEGVRIGLDPELQRHLGDALK